MRGRPSRYNVPDVMRGPRFSSTGPCRNPHPLASLVSRLGLAALLADKRFAQIAGEERLYKASFRKVAEGSDTGIVNIYFQLSVQLIASR